MGGRDPQNRKRILETAIQVFAEKGKHGASIEEIAQRADVNKRMVYYYFESKEKLHFEVIRNLFDKEISEMVAKIQRQPFDPENPIDAIKIFTRAHYTTIVNDRDMIRVLFSAVATDPDVLKDALQSLSSTEIPIKNLAILTNILQEGINKGKLREVNVKQLILNIISMNFFFIYGTVMAENLLGLHIEDEELFLQERLNSIIDLVLYGIVERRSLS